MKLDLGSGAVPQEGFIGIDLYCGERQTARYRTEYPYTAYVADNMLADHVYAVDLTRMPWSWCDDESVEEVWCSHFVEHLDRQWVQFVDELYRILVPGGVAQIIHPNALSSRAFQDPTHRDIIPAERWLYCSKQWRKDNGLDHPPYPTCDFGTVEEIGAGLVFSINPAFELRNDETKMFALTHYWNAAGDVHVRLVKPG